MLFDSRPMRVRTGRAAILAGWVLVAGSFAPLSGAAAYTYKVIHDFCAKRACGDGGIPQANLMMDGAGNLYGTTTGGQYDTSPGTVFELVPNADKSAWKEKTLHTFCSSCTENGTAPRGGLIIDMAGNLYGTTFDAGPAGAGIVYELLPVAGKYKRAFKILRSFSPASGLGSYPAAGLTYRGAATGVPYDGTSPLYGTTFAGGTGEVGGDGVVFSLTPSAGAWSESVLYEFCSQADCADGSEPFAGLIADADGNLYGTTYHGGSAVGDGTAFRLAANSGVWTETVLYAFCAQAKCVDGANPRAPLVSDALGNLYGTAVAGGPFKKGCCGVVFRLSPNGGQYAAVYAFCAQYNCRDGSQPNSDLVQDASGTLYGTTSEGGGNNIDEKDLGGGTVFALSGSSLQTLHRFCAKPNCGDGEYPQAGLLMDASGNLFGTTASGGRFGKGVAFELTP